jgi:outer membrane protein assembly factor BamB
LPRAGALNLDDSVIGGLALDAASGMLYVTSGPNLYRVSAAGLARRMDDGAAAVEYTRLLAADDDIWSTPVLHEGKVLVSSLDGSLYAVDMAGGRELWRFSTSQGLATTPVVSGSTVYVAGFDNSLHAVDIANGNAKWRFQATNWIWTRPALDGNRAYVADFDGKVYAVDLSTGSEVWQLALDKGPVRSGPVVAGGVLIVASDNGWLTAIDPSTQAIRWQKQLGSSLRADLVVAGGDVLLAPTGCTTLPDIDSKVFYTSVDPTTGALEGSQGVC